MSPESVSADTIAYSPTFALRMVAGKFTVSALRLADVSLYTEFSIPRLHVSAAINATRFSVALDAEVNQGVFRDVKLNDDWVPGETLLLDNNMLTCQLLIPQITALIDILWTLMVNTPRTAQYALSFAHTLRDYQLAKIRKEHYHEIT